MVDERVCVGGREGGRLGSVCVRLLCRSEFLPSMRVPVNGLDKRIFFFFPWSCTPDSELSSTVSEVEWRPARARRRSRNPTDKILLGSCH